MAKASVTALTLLDLSAAFDTTDPTLFSHIILCIVYEMSELALGWFKSYLLERTLSEGRQDSVISC